VYKELERNVALRVDNTPSTIRGRFPAAANCISRF